MDYYVLTPAGKALRKQIRLKKVAKGNAGKLHMRKMLALLTKQLQEGWRPWTGRRDDPAKQLTLDICLDRWEAQKASQLRHSSPYHYASFNKVIRTWAKRESVLDIPIGQFDRSLATRFLTYVGEERGVNNRTFNNYVVYCGMLFKWFHEQDFLQENPFEKQSKRKVTGKSRTYLTQDDRRAMAQWIQQNDPDFWLACMFIYGTLIRPAELRRLRVHHVNLERQVVHVPAEESKSGTERTPSIPNWMLAELRQMGLDKMPAKAWLIGKSLVPGDTPLARNTLNRHWVRMRTALNWPDSKQLYSLRDTGIIQLLQDGVDLLHVRDQAGHTEISTTNKYLRHAFPKGSVEVREKATSLHSSSPNRR